MDLITSESTLGGEKVFRELWLDSCEFERAEVWFLSLLLLSSSFSCIIIIIIVAFFSYYYYSCFLFY